MRLIYSSAISTVYAAIIEAQHPQHGEKGLIEDQRRRQSSCGQKCRPIGVAVDDVAMDCLWCELASVQSAMSVEDLNPHKAWVHGLQRSGLILARVLLFSVCVDQVVAK